MKWWLLGSHGPGNGGLLSDSDSDVDDGPIIDWFGVDFDRNNSADFSDSPFPFVDGDTWQYEDLDSDALLQVQSAVVTFQGSFPAIRLNWRISHPTDNQLSDRLESMFIARGVDNNIYMLAEKEFNEDALLLYNPRQWLPNNVDDTSNWLDHRGNLSRLADINAAAPNSWQGTLQVNRSIIGRDAAYYHSQHSASQGALVAVSRSIVAWHLVGST